jgi:hypothetical protein
MTVDARPAGSKVAFITFVGLLISAAPLVSCGDVSEPAPAPPVPVVEVLLIAGQSEQTARIQYSSPAQPVVPLVQVPVDPDSVALELDGPGGSRTPFLPVAESLTTFRASLLVTPGETYTVSGTVAGVALEATTTVPGSLQIREPAQDTIVLSSSTGFTELAYSWSAPGASRYAVGQIDKEGRSQFTGSISDTVGVVLLIPFFDSQSDTTSLVVWAYDPSAEAFFLNRDHNPVSGSSSAILGFGSLVQSPPQKTVIWQP